MKSKHSGDPELTESNADYGYADSLDTNEHEQISTLKKRIIAHQLTKHQTSTMLTN